MVADEPKFQSFLAGESFGVALQFDGCVNRVKFPTAFGDSNGPVFPNVDGFIKNRKYLDRSGLILGCTVALNTSTYVGMPTNSVQ